MSWETVRLGEIASFSNGINFDKTAYSHGIKLIGVSDFGNRFFPDLTNLQEVKKEAVRDNDYLKDGDIVFVRSNGNKELVGRCMLIQHPSQPVTFSGFVIRGRLHNTEKYDPVFFTYHFKNSTFRRAMSGTAVGANIQNLSQARLSAYVAEIPDIDTQHKIADILSVYDNLIENNQKQIKLLEEAAQRLYKEWFIDLRFPGYEDTPIVDGVPEGWKKKTIFDMSSVLRRGISPKYSENGKFTVINQKCIRQTIMDINESRKQEKEYSADMNLIDSDIVICSTGSGTLGRVGQVFGDYPDTTFDSHVTLLRAKNAGSSQFLFWAIKNLQPLLMTLGQGSTNQLELPKRVIESYAIICPTDELIYQFESVAQPIHDKITFLVNIINNATEARDRLLPKLMSGEIEV